MNLSSISACPWGGTPLQPLGEPPVIVFELSHRHYFKPFPEHHFPSLHGPKP
jgi:hypothetical protein